MMSKLPNCPHPGALLKKSFLDPLKISVSEAARDMNVPRETFRDFVAGKSPVTPELALKLGAITGVGGSAWMFAQARYDLSKAVSGEGVLEATREKAKSWLPRNSGIRTHVLEQLFPSGAPRVFNYFLQGK
jgi:addiction module HigA family antidote